MQLQVAGFRKIMHEEEMQQEQRFENMTAIEPQLSVQLHAEEFVMAALMGRVKETSERERQAARHVQEITPFFQERGVRSDISLLFVAERSQESSKRKGGS